ncbi:hypothetical protein BT96DRAFT_749923, partial [Gymnopus androsaceus JB14]
KIISITCGNASMNTAMLEDLKQILPNFLGKDAHVHCMSHTVNLMAKGMLCPFE